jgi:hypothetical protein
MGTISVAKKGSGNDLLNQSRTQEVDPPDKSAGSPAAAFHSSIDQAAEWRSSGSLAIFAAIRRASSRVRSY